MHIVGVISMYLYTLRLGVVWSRGFRSEPHTSPDDVFHVPRSNRLWCGDKYGGSVLRGEFSQNGYIQRGFPDGEDSLRLIRKLEKLNFFKFV